MSQSPANTHTKIFFYFLKLIISRRKTEHLYFLEKKKSIVHNKGLVTVSGSLLMLIHLSDAELVEALIMPQDCNLIGHCSTNTEPIINL